MCTVIDYMTSSITVYIYYERLEISIQLNRIAYLQ